MFIFFLRGVVFVFSAGARWENWVLWNGKTPFKINHFRDINLPPKWKSWASVKSVYMYRGRQREAEEEAISGRFSTHPKFFHLINGFCDGKLSKLNRKEKAVSVWEGIAFACMPPRAPPSLRDPSPKHHFPLLHIFAWDRQQKNENFHLAETHSEKMGGKTLKEEFFLLCSHICFHQMVLRRRRKQKSITMPKEGCGSILFVSFKVRLDSGAFPFALRH